jgi:hypothetical protein
MNQISRKRTKRTFFVIFSEEEGIVVVENAEIVFLTFNFMS